MSAVNELATLNDRLIRQIDQMAENVIALAEINSGSFNVDGVDRCGERLADLAQSLDPDVVETLAVGPTITLDENGHRKETSMGRALRVAKRGDAAFRICVFGHLDTVFPSDHPFQQVSRQGDVLRGPGVADCKGGLIIALEALRHLERTDWGSRVGWEFIAVPDEEVGSHGSKALLATIGSRCQLGLGIEPALPGGGIAAARKGSLTVHAICRGLPAHVGRAHNEGRSAIRAAAQFLDQLEDCNSRPGLTVNCGAIRGGGPLNVVPDFAVASFNVRVLTNDDHQWIQDRVATLAAQVRDRTEVSIDIDWIAARPPKERSDTLEVMLGDAEAAGDMVGDPIVGEDTGGSCDGNDLAAAGLINLDSMGIRGGGIHSENEFADVASIPSRSAIMSYLIQQAYQRQDAG